MSGQGNAKTVIVKKVKLRAHGGGHGSGAWKVAYADFVTAMMAFFMLMWLLNATTEKQRKGLADYFNPTIAVSRVSGGGEGLFGGHSVQSQEILAQMGLGGMSPDVVTDLGQLREGGKDDLPSAVLDPALFAMQADVDKRFAALRGESMTMERLLRHVVSRVSDEGLVIELFDLDGAPLFRGESNEPAAALVELSALLVEVLALTKNGLALNGHVRARSILRRQDAAWESSSERAHVLRVLLREAGLQEARVERIAGHGARKPLLPNAMAARNNRLEVVLLRKDR